MKIDYNTIAHVIYKLHINSPDGDLIEFADEKNPRSMIFGLNRIISGFEEQMVGIEEGGTFDFQLNPDQAFGEYRSELMVDVPKSSLMVNGKLKEDLLFIGNEISMMDNHENPMKGKVIEVGEEMVKMDFNHPLAGQKLFINGKVINVRPITPEDLQLQNDGCCGGGCGCGSSEEHEIQEHAHSHAEADDCQVCGNPTELQGQGIGDCRCG